MNFKDVECQNASGKLCFHRQSLRGRIQDYVISFEERTYDIQSALGKTYDLFQQLMNKFQDYTVKARLIAQVNYVRLNDRHEEMGEGNYHFASYMYKLEEVEDALDYYTRHMNKISERMAMFHQNGSRLLVNYIKHIHIELCMIPKQTEVKVGTILS